MADAEHQKLVVLGERIRALREASGRSQQTLHDEANIDRTHISKLEQGRLDPRLSTLARVAEALDTTVSDLLTDLY